MAAIAPVICFVFIYVVLFRNQTINERSFFDRELFLTTAIIWAILVTAITEILSVFSLLTFVWMLGSWLFLILIAASAYFLPFRGGKQNITVGQLPKFSGFSLFSISAIIAVVFCISVIAVCAPPNNYDSMVYHMSRVVHWIQNRSVAHYPTHTLRQLFTSPWAEFAATHFQLLSYSDRFANLVQWFSMVGSLIGVSLIARELKANPKAQIFASVVCITIPMGILQASSTQVDYVASFWLVCFVYFTLHTDGKKLGRSDLLKLGGALGLAIFTKPTAFVYALPFIVGWAVRQVKNYRWNIWRPFFALVSIVLLINLGQYARNIDLGGSPFGQDIQYLFTKSLSLPLVISNCIRNVALHLTTPWEPLNIKLERAVYLVHKLLHFDVNDPRMTIPGLEFHVYNLSLHEDSAGNFIHFILITATLCLFFLRHDLKNHPVFSQYLIALLSGFILFCAFIKWQPWNSRFHLPLFVLWSPLIAAVLLESFDFRIIRLIAIILLFLSLPYLLGNKMRPLIGNDNIFNMNRTKLYFKQESQLLDVYAKTAEFLRARNCSSVGLELTPGHNYEYPFWVLIRQTAGQGVRIEHVNVENISKRKYDIYSFNQFSPCAVVSMNSKRGPKMITRFGSYAEERLLNPVRIYVKK